MFIIICLVNWFKRDGSNSDSNDNYDNADLSSDTSAFIRQPSLYHPTSKLTHRGSSRYKHFLVI